MSWKMTTNSTTGTPLSFEKDHWVKFENEATDKKIEHILIESDYQGNYHGPYCSISIATSSPSLISWFFTRGYTVSGKPKKNIYEFKISYFKYTDSNDNVLARFLIDLQTIDPSLNEVITQFFSSFAVHKPAPIKLHEFNQRIQKGDTSEAIKMILDDRKVSLMDYGALLEVVNRTDESKVTSDHVIQFYQNTATTQDVKLSKASNEALLSYLSGLNTNLFPPKKKMDCLEYQFQAAVNVCEPCSTSLFHTLTDHILKNETVIIPTEKPSDLAKAFTQQASRMRKLAERVKQLKTKPAELPNGSPQLDFTSFSGDIPENHHDSEPPTKYWKKENAAKFSGDVNYKNSALNKKMEYIYLHPDTSNTYSVSVATHDPDIILWFSQHCYQQIDLDNKEELFVFKTHRLQTKLDQQARTGNSEFANFLFDLLALDDSFHEVITDIFSNNNISTPFSINMFTFNRMINNARVSEAINYLWSFKNEYEFPFVQFASVLESKLTEPNTLVTIDHVIQFYRDFPNSHRLFATMAKKLLVFLFSLENKYLDEESKLRLLEYKFEAALIQSDPVAPHLYRELCGAPMTDPLLPVGNTLPQFIETIITQAREIRQLATKINSLETPKELSVSVTKFSLLAAQANEENTHTADHSISPVKIL